MNKRIIKLGIESGMLNYVEHETPRHYFLCGNADEECLEKFAELIVRECISIVDDAQRGGNNEIWDNAVKFIRRDIKEHFGVDQ